MESTAGVVIGTKVFTRQSEIVEGTVQHDASADIAGSLQDFLTALETGAIPMGERHDNVRSLAMVSAAIESSTTGRRVPISLQWTPLSRQHFWTTMKVSEKRGSPSHL
jgi:predicted dehydrogenase